MNKYFSDVRPSLAAAGCMLLVLTAAGCHGSKPRLPPDPALADQFLMERGREALAKKRWTESREFFRQIVDNYSASPLRPAAKLALADSYLGEASTESLLLAATEYREYMTFYPTDPKNDYAQYNLAMTYFKQMKRPDRDQTATKEALAEFDAFFQRFPNSPLTTQVREKWRIARDRLSDSELAVARTYARIGVLRGAEVRLQGILKDDPNFTNRDAVYFELAEIYLRADNTKARALPFYQRLIDEFKTSEYLEKAQKRLKELTAK